MQNLFKGPKAELEIPINSIAKIKCSDKFSVFSIFEGERVDFLGPYTNEVFVLQFQLPTGITQVEMDTHRNAHWTIEIKAVKPKHEVVDPVPIEAPLTKPKGIIKTIQEAVNNEISLRAANREMETFEEANDFEYDEDPDFPVTEGEMLVMSEEYLNSDEFYNDLEANTESVVQEEKIADEEASDDEDKPDNENTG